MTQIEEAIRAERREYFKEWRKKNPEKARQHNADYWKRRAEKRLAEQQAHARTGDQNG